MLQRKYAPFWQNYASMTFGAQPQRRKPAFVTCDNEASLCACMRKERNGLQKSTQSTNNVYLKWLPTLNAILSTWTKVIGWTTKFLIGLELKRENFRHFYHINCLITKREKPRLKNEKMFHITISVCTDSKKQKATWTTKTELQGSLSERETREREEAEQTARSNKPGRADKGKGATESRKARARIAWTGEEEFEERSRRPRGAWEGGWRSGTPKWLQASWAEGISGQGNRHSRRSRETLDCSLRSWANKAPRRAEL